MDTKLAMRNIWRNPRRSLLTTLAITVATILLVFMLSWQFGSYATMINTTVKMYSGHIQVQAKGFQKRRETRLVVSDPEKIAEIIDKAPGKFAYTFRGSAFSLASSKERTYGIVVYGIDPQREAKVSTLKSLIREGNYLSKDDGASALVGKLLAKNMGVKVGDEIVLLGQGRDGSVAATVVKVKGIFSFGQDDIDRNSLYIPLSYFQEVYYMGQAVHEVVLVGNSLKSVGPEKRAILSGIQRMGKGGDLVVLDWKELIPGLIDAIKMDLSSGFIFYIILIIVVAFSIMNTFLMAIFERTREFGVLISIGAAPLRLTKVLLIESSAMALIGVMTGIVAGSLITWYFQLHGIVMSGATELLQQWGLPGRMYPRLSLLSVSIGSGIVLFIVLLTALYPAFTVRKIKPVMAMKAV